MSKSWTDLTTWLVMLFIFSMSMWAILSFSNILADKDADGDITLTNDTLVYIANINNYEEFNLSEYQATKGSMEDPEVFEVNSSEGTPKDFSIEYFEAKERASGYTNTIKRIYNIPTTIIFLVGFPEAEFNDAIKIIFWIFGFFIGLSLYWFFRGVKG